MISARALAFTTLCAIEAGAYADAALDRTLRRATQCADSKPNSRGVHRSSSSQSLSSVDRRLLTELVYGCIRRQRTLDALIDQFAQKPAAQQPPKLRLLLHLGFYQLRYLDHVPASAAVNTTVDLAKSQGMKGLSGFVNGILRAYSRAIKPERLEKSAAPSTPSDQSHLTSSSQDTDSQYLHSQYNGPGFIEPLNEPLNEPLKLPEDPIARLGVLHSYPDWIIETWRSQLANESKASSKQLEAELEALARWFNKPPHLDLRINSLKTSRAEVQAALEAQGFAAELLSLPQGLRLHGAIGPIQSLPGFAEGLWIVQDSSAQLVAHLLDPQPGETVIDACAAPGGKTTHIAELMQNTGVIWACDRTASRLKKLKQNAKRLGLKNIRIHEGDSTAQSQFARRADRVLLDVPCSGLGTLHRHADARWRQTPTAIAGLVQLQQALMTQAATWIRGNGTLVYATCTLQPQENEQVIQAFLRAHPQWKIQPPSPKSPAFAYATQEGWCKVWPHRAEQDGFFLVRLAKLG